MLVILVNASNVVPYNVMIQVLNPYWQDQLDPVSKLSKHLAGRTWKQTTTSTKFF